jgi:hypothetical protein
MCSAYGCQGLVIAQASRAAPDRAHAASVRALDHFHRALQQLGELICQRDTLCEQVKARREFHQEIHVAVSALFASRHRAEHADAARSVPATQRVDGLALSMQFVKQQVDFSS